PGPNTIMRGTVADSVAASVGSFTRPSCTANRERISSIRSSSSASALSTLTSVWDMSTPRSSARMNAKTEAASTTETQSCSPEASVTWVVASPVGRRLPVVFPAGSRYRVTTGEPAPGRPSTTCLPSTRKVPLEVGTSASIFVPVFSLCNVTRVTGSWPWTSPSSRANGPTAVVRLPQLPFQSIWGALMATWPNQYVSSPSLGSSTTTTLLVEE